MRTFMQQLDRLSIEDFMTMLCLVAAAILLGEIFWIRREKRRRGKMKMPDKE